MGCVLGKPTATEDEHEPEPEPKASDATTTTTTTTTTATHSVKHVLSACYLKEAPAWPPWLASAAGDALRGWAPRRPDSFIKLHKVGSGTYSNVYKARDVESGALVALKKVRLDGTDAEAVRFMAREIALLRRLGSHPNVVQLHGLVTSRVSNSLYLVLEYMEHDLAGLASRPDVSFSLPQIKCYMKQLLTGLEHCHSGGVLHRDIKGSNLLLDNEGNLKIADFGLATDFDPDHKKPMTSQVVTLWYRPPELILGATYYGVGVDLWSAGCILAELLSGKPILPGRTEVEQLHRIFKLCGSPSEEYRKKLKFPHKPMFKLQQTYKRCIAETFKDFPPSALSLIETLLAIDPKERGTATAALNSEFFKTEPFACEPSSLPQYPPSKEMDAKLRDEKARRQKMINGKGNGDGTSRRRMINGKGNGDGTKLAEVNNRRSRAVPAPEANAELQVNLGRRWLMANVNVTSKSEKFPPPHQDAAVGIPRHASTAFVSQDSFPSFIFDGKRREVQSNSVENSVRGATRSKKVAPSQALPRTFGPQLLAQPRGKAGIHRRDRGKELEVFGAGK